MPKTLTVRALVLSRIDAQEFATAHEDLRKYYGDRHRAMAAAFGVDFEAEPVALERGTPQYEAVADGDPLAHHNPYFLKRMAQNCEEALRDLRSPFSGYLEAPAVVRDLAAAHGRTVDARVTATREAILDLLVDVTCRRFNLAPETAVSASALAAHGFDPDGPAPVLWDYL